MSLTFRHAYLQVELENESRPFITINPHRGLYQYQRLPYVVASVPAMWQGAMDQVLQDLPGVFFYLDDIIVTRGSMEEHLQWLVAISEGA